MACAGVDQDVELLFEAGLGNILYVQGGYDSSHWICSRRIPLSCECVGFTGVLATSRE